MTRSETWLSQALDLMEQILPLVRKARDAHPADRLLGTLAAEAEQVRGGLSISIARLTIEAKKKKGAGHEK